MVVLDNKDLQNLTMLDFAKYKYSARQYQRYKKVYASRAVSKAEFDKTSKKDIYQNVLEVLNKTKKWCVFKRYTPQTTYYVHHRISCRFSGKYHVHQ